MYVCAGVCVCVRACVYVCVRVYLHKQIPALLNMIYYLCCNSGEYIRWKGGVKS